MPWTNSTSVREDTDDKIREMKSAIDARRSNVGGVYEHELVAKIVTNSLAAGNAIRREWFCDSVGVTWEDGDQDTYYISRAPIASTFTDLNVVNWTHWIGRLSAQIRDHLEVHGQFPTQLVYGPPHKPQQVQMRRVGPWVRYRFVDGRFKHLEYRDVSGVVEHTDDIELVQAPSTIEILPSPIADVAPAFGLKDIVELRDLNQDDQIRGPMAGVYILTGGPGVGKTSVALHRIPYLLLQQHEQLPVEVPNAPRHFFRIDTMHVVVWKEHLVPYLQNCLQDLNFGGVPVHHIEDWVARTLREYVRIGKGKDQYQISPSEPGELSSIKLGGPTEEGISWSGFTEQMIAMYLTGRRGGRFLRSMAADIASDLTEVEAGLADIFSGQPLRPNLRSVATDVIPTVAGIEAAVQTYRDGIERLAEEISEAIRLIKTRGKTNQGTQANDSRPYERMRPLVVKARERVAAVRDRLIERLTTGYPLVLAEFYDSALARTAVSERFGSEAADHFANASKKRIFEGHLSQCDRYLLLWIIQIITRGASSEKQLARPLRQYSHTVIDEAQYYHPLLLRLLVDLAMPPVGSVTIVGDLEQKVSSHGGLVSWNDAGIKIDAGKIYRLNTNYRWSKAVFAFLDKFRERTGLTELKEPRRWASGAGLSPVVTQCGNVEIEIAWLVDRVAEIRRTDQSIAVVVPPGLQNNWQNALIAELASCDIRSRWAIGEDVRECQEQIILTDYDSIVGLEFDNVFLPSCDRILSPPKPAAHAIQAAWVALTRARQFVAVSHIGPLAVFDNKIFDEYRVKQSNGM